jgi:hypothetical protein
VVALRPLIPAREDANSTSLKQKIKALEKNYNIFKSKYSLRTFDRITALKVSKEKNSDERKKKKFPFTIHNKTAGRRFFFLTALPRG